MASIKLLLLVALLLLINITNWIERLTFHCSFDFFSSSMERKNQKSRYTSNTVTNNVKIVMVFSQKIKIETRSIGCEQEFYSFHDKLVYLERNVGIYSREILIIHSYHSLLQRLIFMTCLKMDDFRRIFISLIKMHSINNNCYIVTKHIFIFHI